MNHFRVVFLLLIGLTACDQVAKRADVLYTQEDTVVEVARDVLSVERGVAVGDVPGGAAGGVVEERGV